MIGTTIGAFEIVSALGEGGMGRVYRARDTELGRDVALKVLPAAFANDAERVARFRREAQVLASLNHEHIAAIHGLEAHDGVPVLVLELVEGPTLADRLVAGPIPAREAIGIARQIAMALEAAHDRGIVHRDLKPANIKLRPDGVVKVLDFGLAKLVEPGDAGRTGSAPAVTASPTITSPAATRLGVILGTASYMSPEQARGLEVGQATDIWAWGCVLFEMLTGARAFDGADTTEAIAAVVRGEPDWSRLSEATPAAIRRLLGRCLAKDPKQRQAHIRDARFALEEADAPSPAAPAAAGRFPRERLLWIAALALCVVGGLAIWRWGLGAAAPASRMTRLEIVTPPTTDPVSLALSPDGNWLAYVASSDGRSRLWLRSLRTGESKLLPGTDGAQFPFWKPDSRSIGFFASERVLRIDVDGGSLIELARAPVAAGGTWNDRGDVLFSRVPDGPVFRVSESGGPPAIAPGSVLNMGGNRFPTFLPDGRRFLYYMAGAGVRGVYVGSLDGPERRRLFDADAAVTVMPPDEMLVLRAGVLYLQRFDPASLSPVGDPSEIARGLAVDSAGAAAASASADGTIVVRAGIANRLRQLTWFDRSGHQIGDALPPDVDNPINPALSPDERSVVVQRTTEGNTDLWLLDLTRPGTKSKITTAPEPDIGPAWGPDGRLAYASLGESGFDIYVKAAPTTGGDVKLREEPTQEIPVDWSRDGRFILYRTQDQFFRPSLVALPADGAGQPISVAKTGADDRAGQFSPDGKWVAFESNESGHYEVYVQPFPGPGVKKVASAAGGRQPRWGLDGRELFYVAPDAKLMSVPITMVNGGREIEPGQARSLFVAPISSTPSEGSIIEYAVSRDGRRFLMDVLVEQTASPITVILNVPR